MRISVPKYISLLTVVVLLVAAPGCATKKYAREQAGVVNQRITQVETNLNGQIAALGSKHQADISRVDEQIAAVDNKVTATDRLAQQANAKAGEAAQLAQSNQAAIAANSTELAALRAANKYSMVELGNVTFGFDNSKLNTEAKAALDIMIQKIQGLGRPVIELEGYTDETGSQRYNLALSRRRAEAVARYLVAGGVPLRGIRYLGRGEEQTPAELAADFQAVAGNASASDMRMLARRVRIRVYASDGSQ